MPIPFSRRHIGPTSKQIQDMLSELGLSKIDDLIDKVVPKNILDSAPLNTSKPLKEVEALKRLTDLATKNHMFSTFIGMGYFGTILPGVIQRNILENPGWYTQYTPYQAEISQGRLEALLNFQTMVSDLTGLPLSNASLLDEGTAAAEAMVMFFNASRNQSKKTYLISKFCHPQTIDVLETRAAPLDISLKICDIEPADFGNDVFGALVQYPDTNGSIEDFTNICSTAHKKNAFVCMATDLLALVLLKTPGEMGADAAVGNAQRFGVPMGFGGPHAAFFATTDKFKRKIPGRIIGVSTDKHGQPALRMALQTREQHIRREKATSNICTAQVLLAIISGMYAVYHGPDGLKIIANRINKFTSLLATSLQDAGYTLLHSNYFDTIRFKAAGWKERANQMKLNFRDFQDGTVGISISEATDEHQIKLILDVFNAKKKAPEKLSIPDGLIRKTNFLEHPVFHNYRSETAMLRYIHKLETKDLSLNTSMIPLGSCTMKLNSTTEMMPVTWPHFNDIHPFVPKEQTEGYLTLINELSEWLVKITGFESISMQPNSGAQGEYAGLMTIRAFHLDKGQGKRNICLIPSSAHGTNPASAIMAGMKVVIVNCDKYGNIDEKDFEKKVVLHAKNLAAVMITYPSTHGVFEHNIKELCELVHNYGGQVYMDGANLNALVGLCKPGKFGADVMHINLHKTFCIPHGGGGPGMGPIVCKNHLADYLPGHISLDTNTAKNISAVSSAPYGSSSILPISWAYIAMMGDDGLKKSSQIAILSANYMAKKLSDHFPVLYRGISGFVAHEFIIDIRPIKESSGVSEEDIAKRLMDYGFHAPTMSWPVPGTMMIEPTESESKIELDRFCEAMICIKKEIDDIINNKLDKNDNPLKHAPHTAVYALSDEWNHLYSRSLGCYPGKWQKDYKYWPPVGRIDNAYGDRNLVCTCPPTDIYKDTSD